VCAWLHEIGLGQYAITFRGEFVQHSLSGLHLLGLEASELADTYGMASETDRARFLAAIESWRLA
jgi:hypothetical protein